VKTIFLLLLSFTALAQDCCFSPTLLHKDTAFVMNDYTLLLLEQPTKDKYKITITFEKEVPPVVTTLYDNTDASIVYSQGWYNGATTAAGFSNGTMAYHNLIGGTMTFQFTGHRLEWIAEQKIGSGRVGIIIDTKPEEIINLGLVNAGNGVVKGWDLTPGFHTIKTRIIDNRYIVSDGYRVIR